MSSLRDSYLRITSVYPDYSSQEINSPLIISKYGRNSDVDGPEDIWNGGGDYTGFPTGAAENLFVVSSSINDSLLGTGARRIRIFYLNENFEAFDENGELLFVDVDLAGIVPVDTGVLATRMWRSYVLESGSSQSNVGAITVRWAVDVSSIFCNIPVNIGQTDISNFTVPSGYSAILNRFSCSIFDSTNNRAEVGIKVRDFGSNTFRITNLISVSTNSEVTREFKTGLKFAEKTDLVFRCTSVQNANGNIQVDYDMELQRN